MINLTKRYLLEGILVEATKTIGGLFYDVTVVSTGEKVHVVAVAFEKAAKPAPEIMSSAADPEAAT
jgi:hypothetical protein